jgi:hypothetical protein
MISFIFKKNNKGFLVLTLMLIVCATVLIITTGSILRSIGQVNESSNSEMSLKAWNTVNACGETALMRLASTTATTTSNEGWYYSGGDSLSVGNETCYIYPIEDSDTAKLIKASSTVSTFTRKILIEVATNTPSIIVNSWMVVADL